MEIPETIVNQAIASKLKKQFNELYEKMVDAYEHLPKHLSEAAFPVNPKMITASWLHEYTQSKRNPLDQESVRRWSQVYTNTIGYVRTIEKFFEAFPDAEIQVEDNSSKTRGERLSCTNKMDMINSAATVEVPEKCKSILRILMNGGDIYFMTAKAQEVYARHPGVLIQNFLNGHIKHTIY